MSRVLFGNVLDALRSSAGSDVYKPKPSQIASWCFWVTVGMGTVYLSYRYPFQINSAGTSPTYTNTPFALQAAKFVLLLPVGMVSCILALRRRFTHWQLVIICAFFLLSGLAALKMVAHFEPPYLKLCFWPMLALVVSLAPEEFTFRSFDRYFSFLLWYSLGSDAMEFFLFKVTGRLPALAYKHSISVRFGGFLDDPNAFPCFLFLLMGWVHNRFRGSRRIVLQLSLIACVLLTQSLTGIAFLCGLLLVVAVWWSVKRPVAMWALVFCLSYCAVLASSYYDVISSVIQRVLLTKSASIVAHGVPVETAMSTWTSWGVLGHLTYQHYESWWFSSVVNFGIPWAVLFLIISVAMVVNIWMLAWTARHAAERAIYVGMGMFCTYVLVGAGNLPLFIEFPAGLLFFIFCFVCFWGAWHRHPVGTPGPVSAPRPRGYGRPAWGANRAVGNHSARGVL